MLVTEQETEVVDEEVVDASASLGQFRRVAIDRDLSVGAMLKEERQVQVRTLAYFARKVNIPERYLKAIEEEDFPTLPGLVYEKHFVHRYAAALRLDPEPLVAQWVVLREGDAKPLTRFVPRVRRRDLWISPLFLRRGVISVLFLVASLYVGGRLYAMVAPPSLHIEQPNEGQILREASLTVRGDVPSDATVSVNGQAVAIASDGHFSVPLTLAAGPNTIRIEAGRRYSNSTIIERRVFLAPIDHLTAVPATNTQN